MINKFQKILNNYEDDFQPDLGTMKGVGVAIDVNPNAKPKFLKAIPVPLLKTKLRQN